MKMRIIPRTNASIVGALLMAFCACPVLGSGVAWADKGAPSAKASLASKPAGSQMVSGIVFGFVRAHGSGIVHLKSLAGLFKLHYRDSQIASDGQISPFQCGALWKVVYKGSEISKALFAGQVASSVHAADTLVRHHFQLLGAKKWGKAYSDLGAAWRQQQSLADFIQDCKKTPLAWTTKNPPSYILLVTSGSPKEVQEVIYIPELQEYYRYTVIKAGKALWQIDHVDQINKADFDKA
jgi:hypothetical protein